MLETEVLGSCVLGDLGVVSVASLAHAAAVAPPPKLTTQALTQNHPF